MGRKSPERVLRQIEEPAAVALEPETGAEHPKIAPPSHGRMLAERIAQEVRLEHAQR
jgi:hypothetical protein